MANEISIESTITIAPPIGTSQSLPYSKQITMSGSRVVRAIQQIGTSAEALGVGEISSMGVLIIKNLDATNFVSVRNGSGGADLCKIKPGEQWEFRLPPAAVPYAVADTAACYVEYILTEN